MTSPALPPVRIEGLVDPSGVDTPSPRLSWQARSTSAVDVVVLDDDGGVVWSHSVGPRAGWVDVPAEVHEPAGAEADQVLGGELRRRDVVDAQGGHAVGVATDAQLTPAQGKRVAAMAQDGLARAIRPVHAPFYGDVVFALSTGRRPLHARQSSTSFTCSAMWMWTGRAFASGSRSRS